jgi:YD repeat-containing protein
VTYNYAVGSDPLTTSVTDPGGTVTTVTDLLGRVVSYTDVQGTVTATSCDQAGRVTITTTTPPNSADPAHAIGYTYDDAGRVLLTVLDGTDAAVSGYDTNGELSSVSYANGSSLAAIGKDRPVP